MSTKPLPAKLTIGRVTCSHRDDYISITLIDQASGCEIIEAEVSFEQFTLAITGMGHVPCQAILGDVTVVGKKREAKHEIVFVPDGPYEDRRCRSVAAIAPFEVDGRKVGSESSLSAECHSPSVVTSRAVGHPNPKLVRWQRASPNCRIFWVLPTLNGLWI